MLPFFPKYLVLKMITVSSTLSSGKSFHWFILIWLTHIWLYYSASHFECQNMDDMLRGRAWIRYDEVRESQQWAFTDVSESGNRDEVFVTEKTRMENYNFYTFFDVKTS